MDGDHQRLRGVIDRRDYADLHEHMRISAKMSRPDEALEGF